MLGASDKKSIAGIKLCGGWYWTLLGIFVMFSCGAVYLGVKWSKEEQDLRKKCNINYFETEV
jgi:hypothetical protein